MKILVCTEPGQFEYKEVPDPPSTAGRAVLRVRRVGVCGTDLHAFEGVQPYFSYPRVLGHELSADLADATYAPDFTAGETVTIIPYFACGVCIACRNGKPNACVQLNVFGVHSDGGMQEYISVPVSALVHADGIDSEALALVEPLSIGAHAIRRAGVKEGQTVLVVGAGPIGMACLEMARLSGGRPIAMDVNPDRLGICKTKLGVDDILDARDGDVISRLAALTSGDMAEIVIDATGNLPAINNAFQYLAHGGRYVLVGLQKNEIHFSHPEFHKREATLASSRNATRADFDYVIRQIRSKAILPENYITHRAAFGQVKDLFAGWTDPRNKVVKAMITVGE